MRLPGTKAALKGGSRLPDSPSMPRWMISAATALALGTAPLIVGVPAGASRSAGNVGPPTVTGPVTGGKGAPTLVSAGIDAANGTYSAEEYFLEGTATSYAPVGQLGTDGEWKVKAAETAPYKTRIVVYRPVQRADFNGTVFVEWFNVTAGFDTGADWLSTHTEIIRSGAAWVGVSAQVVGVQGGVESVSDELPAGGIKAGDPERYGSLSHPGDPFSYDIFSQVALAARQRKEPAPLGDLRVRRVIAIGESQAAFRLVTYVNAIQPRAHVFDGFLIHGRAGGSASLGASRTFGQDDRDMPETVRIRRDIDVPVLTFQTETDLTFLGSIASRQRDFPNSRLWEVAGAAHADAYIAGIGFGDADTGAAERTLLDPAAISGGPLGCSTPINSGPSFLVLNAALAHLDRWVTSGTPPPRAPRLETTVDGEIARDDRGIAQGGIRTPLVDVPVATNNGEPNDGGSFCILFGTSKPFDAATLAELYPTREDFVRAFDAATDKAVKAGFLVEPDAQQLKDAAAELPIGG